MHKRITTLTVVFIFFLVGATAYINLSQQRAIDRSKIPENVETSRGFQRWITNLKNKDFDIGADEFRLKDTGEVYNPDHMIVISYDENQVPEIYAQTMLDARDTERIIFSPNDKIFIDHRDQIRGNYQPNEVRFYGLIEDKVVDLRVLDCSQLANCYFDRAFFVDDDTAVVTEISRTIDKRDTTAQPCLTSEVCNYNFKLHLLRLSENKRYVFESEPFDLILDEKKGEF